MCGADRGPGRAAQRQSVTVRLLGRVDEQKNHVLEK